MELGQWKGSSWPHQSKRKTIMATLSMEGGGKKTERLLAIRMLG